MSKQVSEKILVRVTTKAVIIDRYVYLRVQWGRIEGGRVMLSSSIERKSPKRYGTVISSLFDKNLQKNQKT